MRELWKPVVGYEGYYEVSNFGRVYSLRRGIFLSPGKNKTAGQPRLHIVTCVEMVRKNHRVHTLVARAFLGPRPHGKEVNHKDLNPENNRLSNLEYMTKSENIQHAVRNGVKLGVSGEQHYRAKLTRKTVQQVRSLFRSKTLKIAEIARKFKVNYATIRDVVTDRTWVEV